MITAVADLFFVFVGIGLTKAVIEPAAKLFFKRKFLRYAPAVFSMLDEKIPGMFGAASGREIEILVINKLESITGESWSRQEIDQVFSLYDVRIGADKAKQ